MARTRVILKAFLVVFTIYHLLVIVFVPNRNSYFAESLGAILYPYANTLNMNVAWQFFAPEPGSFMFWELEAKQDEATLGRLTLPEENHYFLRPRYNRRVAAMRFFFSDFSRVSSLLIPWACRTYPFATTVSAKIWIQPFPSLDEIREGRTLNDTSFVQPQFVTSESCAAVGELTE